MGSSGSKSKTPSKIEDNKENIQKDRKEQTNKNPSNPSKTIHKTKLMHLESILVPSKPFTELDPDISKELSKEICRIVIETKRGRQIGTGFILAFPIDLEWFYCLVTNEHIINNESINDFEGSNIDSSFIKLVL